VFIMSALALVLGTMQTATAQQEVYFNDFENPYDPLSEWSSTSQDTTPIGCSTCTTFLGQFSKDTVSLQLTDLPRHTSVTVSFDLFVIQSWDGNNSTSGPDVWELRVDGGPTLLHTTFSNAFPSATSFRQAYPDAFPGGDNPGLTGAAEIDTLGYPDHSGYSGANDSVYRLDFTFPHTASILRLYFSGLGLNGVGNESWGIDNVKVSISPVVGGSVSGVSPLRVICLNVTTGQQVVIRNSATLWNCEAAGLIVNTGDIIRQTVRGTAY
jgi:hypothetical protein